MPEGLESNENNEKIENLLSQRNLINDELNSIRNRQEEIGDERDELYRELEQEYRGKLDELEEVKSELGILGYSEEGQRPLID